MTAADPALQIGPGLTSIGHSNHPMVTFIGLLREHGIEVVVDVRSSPYSRFNPQFNRENIKRGLQAVGIDYDFLGDELGGRPPEREFYDNDGHVLYGRVAGTNRFRSGLDRLIERAKHARVTIMCSEEDPAGCHRFLLVTGALHIKGLDVSHIRCRPMSEDGQIRTKIERSERVKKFGIWADGAHEEYDLFGEFMRSPWRSRHPVTRPSAA